jgi:hypothetical protein
VPIASHDGMVSQAGTPDGCEVHDRPLAADHPPAPPALRDALAVIDHWVNDYVRDARLEAA